MWNTQRHWSTGLLSSTQWGLNAPSAATTIMKRHSTAAIAAPGLRGSGKNAERGSKGAAARWILQDNLPGESGEPEG